MKKILQTTLIIAFVYSIASTSYAASVITDVNKFGNSSAGSVQPSFMQGNGLGDAPQTLRSTINPSDIAQPVTASNSSCRIPVDIGSLFNYVLCLLDSAVVPFLIGLGLVLFLVGVLKFVSAGDNEEARQGGRNMMMFGIVSLFVMVSIWGFVNILSRSFFGTDSEIQSLPRKSPTVFKQ